QTERAGIPGDLRDVDGRFNRPVAHKGSLADMAPDAPLLLQHEKRLPQHRPRNADKIRKRPLRRKTSSDLDIAVVQIGSQLHQRSLVVVLVDHALPLLPATGSRVFEILQRHVLRYLFHKANAMTLPVRRGLEGMSVRTYPPT